MTPAAATQAAARAVVRQRRVSRGVKGKRSDGIHVDLQKRVRTWAPRRADISTWANEALGRRAANREVGVRLVGRAESRKLNAHYRGKDYPTNVLSFPASPLAVAPAPAGAAIAKPLGDLVICPQVLRAEAREQRKTLRAHWAHLVVHGALHLIGYDHERDADARRMERREIAVLRRLGFTNPYLSV
jgi:probable rRNA maturation factor